jgi:hypothetical protein
MFNIPIEGRDDTPQRKLLLSEAVRDGSFRGHRMLAGRQVPAARRQPFVQRIEAGEPCQRCEQPFANVAHLVLDLSLFPA